MKNEVILKINKMGKAGEIIAKIIKIILIIAVVACIVGSSLLMMMPREAASITMSHDAAVKFNLDYNHIMEMEPDMATLEINGITYNADKVTTEGNQLSADFSSDATTIYAKDGLWVLIAAIVFIAFCIVAAHLVEKLCKTFRDCETPFTEGISEQLKKVAISLIPVAILAPMVENGADGFMTGKVNIELSVDLLTVLLVVMIFMLAAIFRYGAVLQQESDETL
ncbi:MAG: DUF2975 domain-containing protein [Firmicutes bacterium]|nr:DUF2975 domain-containing protein [Bacillota bacterium]